MSLWQELAAHLKADSALAALDRGQCEAIIDALAWVIYADQEASFLEKTELEHLVAQLPWALADAHAAEEYARQALSLAQEIARDEDARARLAADIAARLGDAQARKQAYKMAAHIAHANWDADLDERRALAALADALQIPTPFAEAILEDVARGHDPQAAGGLDVDTDAESIPASASQTIRDVLSRDFMQGFFSDLFRSDELKHLTEQAALAFVDALAISLVADGYPEPEELEEFRAQLEQLPFSLDDVSHVQARVDIVIETMRQASEPEQLAFIQALSAKIPSQALRERALSMAIMISHADYAITRHEQDMLERIAQGFGVDHDRLAQLIAQVKSAQAEWLD